MFQSEGRGWERAVIQANLLLGRTILHSQIGNSILHCTLDTFLLCSAQPDMVNADKASSLYLYSTKSLYKAPVFITQVSTKPVKGSFQFTTTIPEHACAGGVHVCTCEGQRVACKSRLSPSPSKSCGLDSDVRPGSRSLPAGLRPSILFDTGSHGAQTGLKPTM